MAQAHFGSRLLCRLIVHTGFQPLSHIVRRMANTSISSDMQCSRCHCAGHLAKDCTKLTFLCTTTAAERRAEQTKKKVAMKAEREAKQAEWEAKQLEREAKRAEWEARQAARIKTQASRAYKRDSKDDDSSSNATDFSTTASLTGAIVDENEVERLAMMDKDVRKFVKVLREIVKLECRADIDELQKKKIAKKSEVEDQLYAAKYHAKLRARNQLRYKECA